jgi:DnaJ-class molecular chaperone
MADDPYARLGVTRTDTLATVRQAYRRAVQRWHPDRHPHDPQAQERFVAIQAAYRLLTDATARARYDQQEARVTAPLTPDVARWRDWRPSLWRTALPFAPGDRAHARLTVPLASVMEARTWVVEARVATTCTVCLGRRPGCPRCGGSGQRFVQRQFQVHVPAGTPEGQVLCLRGQGHDGPYFSEPGDVWVSVQWQKAGRWHWRHDRLESHQRGSARLHAQGGRLRVQAPEGQWGTVAVPPCPRHTWIRVPHLGLPDAQGTRAPAWICLR